VFWCGRFVHSANCNANPAYAYHYSPSYSSSRKIEQKQQYWSCRRRRCRRYCSIACRDWGGLVVFKKAQEKGTDHTSLPSSTVGYNNDQKYSVVGSPSSANIPTHNQPDLVRNSSPYSTPPPVQPEHPYHHPAHGQSPIQYYPPPGQPNHPAHGQPPTSLYPPDAARTWTHEMPTVKSPEVTEVTQPGLLRPSVRNE
jgi:hypothetical protein